MMSGPARAVLVTGGSSGLGLEVARRLAGRGFVVGLMARDSDRLNSAVLELGGNGSRLVACRGDAAEPADCARAVAGLIEVAGGLDALVCCAGTSLRAPVAQTSPAVAEMVMRANFWTVFHSIQAALPALKARRGALLAVSSLAGHRGVPGYGVYGAAKRALVGLCESLRLEVAGDGVHVGVFSPGFFDSPLRSKVLDGNGAVIEPPPPIPFRLWPLDLCADIAVHCLEKRVCRRYLPRFVRPLFAFDEATGGGVGDRFLRSRFRGL